MPQCLSEYSPSSNHLLPLSLCSRPPPRPMRAVLFLPNGGPAGTNDQNIWTVSRATCERFFRAHKCATSLLIRVGPRKFTRVHARAFLHFCSCRASGDRWLPFMSVRLVAAGLCCAICACTYIYAGHWREWRASACAGDQVKSMDRNATGYLLLAFYGDACASFYAPTRTLTAHSFQVWLYRKQYAMGYGAGVSTVHYSE